MLLRCTQKLLQALLPRGAAGTPIPDSPDPLHTWFGHIFPHERRSSVLITHPTTLFTFLIPGLVKADFKAFDKIFRENLERNLASERLLPLAAPRLREAPSLTLARTNDRSVLGSMNDFIHMALSLLERDGDQEALDPLAVGRQLRRVPMSAIHYEHPIDEFRALFGIGEVGRMRVSRPDGGPKAGPSGAPAPPVVPPSEGGRPEPRSDERGGWSPKPADPPRTERRDAGTPDPGGNQAKAAEFIARVFGPDPRIDFIVLDVGSNRAECRIPGHEVYPVVEGKGTKGLVPGQVITVKPRPADPARHGVALTGDIQSVRIDAAALGLTPLRLNDVGPWDPREMLWLEEGEPPEPWQEEILALGTRRAYEFERVVARIPGRATESDPMLDVIELLAEGYPAAARKLARKVLRADLRSLRAHVCLGDLEFDNRPGRARLHYEVAVRIGELSLPDGFGGVLDWGFFDNRPFLRALHGYGLCLWRARKWDEAQAVFERLLRLSPGDNLGVRFVLGDVRERRRWVRE